MRTELSWHVPQPTWLPFPKICRKLLSRLVANLIFNKCVWCPSLYSIFHSKHYHPFSLCRGGKIMSRRLSIRQITSMLPLLNFWRCVLRISFSLPLLFVLVSFNMWHLCIFFLAAQNVIPKEDAYPVWTLSLLNNNAIVLCNKCYEAAKAQVVDGRKWQKRIVLQRFNAIYYAWWLDDKNTAIRKERGYTVGCLCCLNPIKRKWRPKDDTMIVQFAVA